MRVWLEYRHRKRTPSTDQPPFHAVLYVLLNKTHTLTNYVATPPAPQRCNYGRHISRDLTTFCLRPTEIHALSHIDRQDHTLRHPQGVDGPHMQIRMSCTHCTCCNERGHTK